MSCDMLRNLSCIVLRIVRENHRRGQKQGNQKAGEGEGISNIGAQTTGAGREREGRGDGLSYAHCLHSAWTRRGGRRRTEGRRQSARSWDAARPGAGVKGGAGQGVPRMVSRVVPVVMNWPEVLHVHTGARPLSCSSSTVLSAMAPTKVCGSRLVPPPLTSLLVSTLVTSVGTPPVWPQTLPPSPHTVRPSRSTIVGLCRALWAA